MKRNPSKTWTGPEAVGDTYHRAVRVSKMGWMDAYADLFRSVKPGAKLADVMADVEKRLASMAKVGVR